MAHNHSLWPRSGGDIPLASNEKPLLARRQAAPRGAAAAVSWIQTDGASGKAVCLFCKCLIRMKIFARPQTVVLTFSSLPPLPRWPPGQQLLSHLRAARPAGPRGSAAARRSRRRSAGPSCWSSASAGWGRRRGRGAAERSRPPSPRHLGKRDGTRGANYLHHLNRAFQYKNIYATQKHGKLSKII